MEATAVVAEAEAALVAILATGTIEGATCMMMAGTKTNHLQVALVTLVVALVEMDPSSATGPVHGLDAVADAA